MLLWRGKGFFITLFLMIQDIYGGVAANMGNKFLQGGFRSLSEVSNSHDVQFGKSGAIEALIKRQQAVPFFQSVSADEKVGQNAAWLTSNAANWVIFALSTGK